VRRRLAILGLRLGSRLRRLYWRAARPTTVGVRVVVVSEGRVLLARHTYIEGWYLPGGGAGRGERLDEAGRREVREELGIELGTPVLVGLFTNLHELKTDHIAVFRAEALSTDLRLSPEIAEARFFERSALPPGLGAATLRCIAALDAPAGEPFYAEW
jgi:ADP-ribose pyrophosphatase YjhB (NUDIX family)